jgi:hypothetical protein
MATKERCASLPSRAHQARLGLRLLARPDESVRSLGHPSSLSDLAAVTQNLPYPNLLLLGDPNNGLAWPGLGCPTACHPLRAFFPESQLTLPPSTVHKQLPKLQGSPC